MPRPGSFAHRLSRLLPPFELAFFFMNEAATLAHTLYYTTHTVTLTHPHTGSIGDRRQKTVYDRRLHILYRLCVFPVPVCVPVCV